jgi:hypothetical protein
MNEIVGERRTTAMLAFFGCSTPRLASDQLLVEIGHAEHQLLQATRGVPLPSWLGSAVLLLSNAVLVATGKSSIRAQLIALTLGLSAILLSLGIHIIGSVWPSRYEHIADYMALLRRAKRRLDLEALERAVEDVHTPPSHLNDSRPRRLHASPEVRASARHVPPPAV